MRLRAIEVSGWQCFAETCIVGEFGPGLNVVHAPNGTGKSTLFGALRRAMFDKHGAAGEEVLSLRAWGRDLTPRVTVTFDHDGVAYRLDKQFLDKPRAALRRAEGGRFVPLADAEKADDRLREMFRATARVGRTKLGPDHWGVAAVGWVEQGRLALDALEPSLAAHVQATLSASALGDGGDAIERAIEDRYLAIYTPTGQLRRGANQAAVVACRERLTSLERRRAEVAPQAQAFEDGSQRVGALERQRHDAEARRTALTQQLNALRATATRRRDFEADVTRSRSAEEKQRAEHDRTRERVEAIRARRAALATLEAGRAALVERGPALRDESVAATRRLDDANAAIATLRRSRVAIASLADDAAAADALARATADAIAIEARLAAVRDADARLAELTAQLATLRSPTSAAMKRLRAAQADRREATVALEASMITLEIVADVAATIDARVAEQPGVQRAMAGEAFVVRGTPEVVVEISGFGRIRASGPAITSVADRRAAVAAADAQLTSLADELGTTDVDVLEARAEAATALRDRVKTAEAERAAALGRSDVGELIRALARATRSRDALLDAHPTWRDVPPDAAELKRTAVARAATHERAEIAATDARDAAADASNRAALASNTHAAKLDELTRRLAETRDELNRLTAADGLDDAARIARADDAAIAWNAARAELARATLALDALGADPTKAILQTERELAAAVAAAVALLKEQSTAEGELNAAAAGGAYSLLADVDEQIAAAREALAVAEAEATAIRLLRDTVRRERERLVCDVAGPVEAIAGDVLRRVAGSRFADVRLGERFAPTSIASPLSAAPIDLTSLSGGEQEQVHLAVRLALAEVLARGGSQLVVLDDVLTATDAGRFGRLQAVLEDFAQRLQILIFTCHPERYAGLRDAKWFDLESIRPNASAPR